MAALLRLEVDGGLALEAMLGAPPVVTEATVMLLDEAMLRHAILVLEATIKQLPWKAVQ